VGCESEDPILDQLERDFGTWFEYVGEIVAVR